MARANILCLIPARGGSKGVPRKNLVELGGKPLLAHTIEAAIRASLTSRVVVSTDDPEIAETAAQAGAEVPFLRPDELATDTTTLLLVVRHALHFFDEKGWKSDAVMSLQPTSPFTSAETIDRACRMFQESGCDSVTTVAEITQGHPYVAKRFVEDGRLENYFAVPSDAILFPRQKRPKAYYYTGALYLRSRSLIENWNSEGYALGRDSRGIVVSERESVDINEPFDVEFAEFLLQKDLS